MNVILVTGGTGTLGRPLVQLLTSRGAAVCVLSRRPPPTPAPPYEWCTGDLRSGQGIEAAVAGAGTIVHCARWVQSVWLPGRAGTALRRGANLAPGHADGQVTFEDYLARGRR